MIAEAGHEIFRRAPDSDSADNPASAICASSAGDTAPPTCNFYATGIAHLVVVGSAYERTPWRRYSVPRIRDTVAASGRHGAALPCGE